jgi:hypothetical protein
MEPTFMVPPVHTVYAELDQLFAESDVRYLVGEEPRRDISDEDAYDSQILAGLVCP